MRELSPRFSSSHASWCSPIQMWAIEQPWRPAERSLFTETPMPLVGALAAAALGALALVELGTLPGAALKVVVSSRARVPCSRRRWLGGRGRAYGPGGRGPPRVGAVAARLEPVGSIAYVGVPLWLWWRARRGALAALGLAGPVPWGAVWTGLAVGAFLGGHLLVSASRTLGVRLRLDDLVLAAVAYDLGANVPAAEAFFRARSSPRPASLAARRGGRAVHDRVRDALYARSLLPKSVELIVGAAFYLTLLSSANCCLFWWSGSLLPGAAAALVFLRGV